MPHWRGNQRPWGIGDSGNSGDGKSSGTTMTAMQWTSPMLCSTCAKNREREGGCCVPRVPKILYVYMCSRAYLNVWHMNACLYVPQIDLNAQTFKKMVIFCVQLRICATKPQLYRTYQHVKKLKRVCKVFKMVSEGNTFANCPMHVCILYIWPQFTIGSLDIKQNVLLPLRLL